MWDILLLSAAAFGAGMLNAAAGGGSFLTLPALISLGLPPPVANATGTLALLPGYFSSAWALRHSLQFLSRSQLVTVCLLGMTGGVCGASLLLVTPARVFRDAVPWLLLLATLVFVFAPALVRKNRAAAPHNIGQSIGILMVSVYGGYFNGGIGIMLLALLSLAGAHSLNTMNGLKNLVSGMITIVSVGIYIAGGLIAWPQAGIMFVTATLGGYTGGRLASRMSPKYLRMTVIAIGLCMTALMFAY